MPLPLHSPPAPPRQVLLFTGHRIDTPDRPCPRFPPSLEPAATHAIATTLASLDAGPADLALCQAASGGDLLFLEACARRTVPSEVMLPFDEARFIERSVRPSRQGAAWEARWQALRPQLARPPQVMPPVAGVDPFERCNLWLLERALAWGADRLRLVCLWDGASGDGPGGTQHMMGEVQRRGGQVCWIQLRELRG